MHHRQKGAALIVGLLLLVIVTVLGVTAIGTANTELVMAGNEQFRERAAQAADAGIETVMMRLRQDVEPMPGNYDEKINIAIPSQGGDRFTTRADYVGESSISNNGSVFTTFIYRVQSTGVSLRNANAVHETGAWTPGPKGPNVPMCPVSMCPSGL
jgi:type IV pilus assembly protein PilX